VSPSSGGMLYNELVTLYRDGFFCYYRQPDPARVEKYRSRGFTLVADPAIP